MKSSKSLDAVKSKIRQWEPDYPCRLCKTYFATCRFNLVFHYLLFQSLHKHNVFNPFRANAPVMFSVFHILTTYVDTSGVNCNTNSHLSAIQASGVSGSIGTKCIKIHLELHF